MSNQPFIDDPRDQVARAIAAAVATPLDEVRVIYLTTAEHFAQIARDHRLPFKKNV